MIPPPRTGNEITSKIDDVIIPQTKTLTPYKSTSLNVETVHIKLILDKMDETPRMCTIKISESILWLKCPILDLSGGYIVHPVPVPLSIINEKHIIKNDGSNNQNLKIFNRGKDRSGNPNITGIIQFLSLPMKNGITTIKIITKPCEVRTQL